MRCRQRRERGAVTMIVVLVLLTVVAASMLILSGMVQSSVNDSVVEDDSIAALFLAESGLERGARAFATSGNCGNIDAGVYAFGRGTFEVISQGTTGLTATQCRIRAVGRVLSANVERAVEKVVDRSLPVNGTFDTPGSCPPAGWAISDDYGGPNCGNVGGDTVVLVYKATNGGSATTVAAHTLAMPVTTTVATAAAIQYDYSVLSLLNNGNVRYTVQVNYSNGGSDQDRVSFSPGEAGTYTGSINVPANVTIVSIEIELRARGRPKIGTLNNFSLTVPGYARPAGWTEPEI